MESEENKANEPEAPYNRITISTFAALEERDREFTRCMTHAQRMEYLQKLNAAVFGIDLIEQEKIFKAGKISIRKSS